MTAADARVHVTTVVSTDPATAFAVFTERTELWWRPEARYRFAAGGPDGALRLEPRLGGAVWDIADDGARETLGEILVWDPPHALRFSFRARHPVGRTEVEVTFEPHRRGTRVSITQHGWGQREVAVKNLLSVLWGDLLNALRRELAAAPHEA